LRAAQKELAETEPAMFLVVLLGLCAGLRKGEIDLLPWSAVKLSVSDQLTPPGLAVKVPVNVTVSN
jgi:hypothetical protein